MRFEGGLVSFSRRAGCWIGWSGKEVRGEDI